MNCSKLTLYFSNSFCIEIHRLPKDRNPYLMPQQCCSYNSLEFGCEGRCRGCGGTSEKCLVRPGGCEGRNEKKICKVRRVWRMVPLDSTGHLLPYMSLKSCLSNIPPSLTILTDASCSQSQPCICSILLWSIIYIVPFAWRERLKDRFTRTLFFR